MAKILFATVSKRKGAPVEGREGVFHVECSGTGSQGESVTFAGRRSLMFTTVASGHMAPRAVSGLNHGAALWTITEGDGAFSGTTRLITSNFTFSDQGDVVDNQYVRIYTP